MAGSARGECWVICRVAQFASRTLAKPSMVKHGLVLAFPARPCSLVAPHREVEETGRKVAFRKREIHATWPRPQPQFSLQVAHRNLELPGDLEIGLAPAACSRSETTSTRRKDGMALPKAAGSTISCRTFSAGAATRVASSTRTGAAPAGSFIRTRSASPRRSKSVRHSPARPGSNAATSEDNKTAAQTTSGASAAKLNEQPVQHAQPV